MSSFLIKTIKEKMDEINDYETKFIKVCNDNMAKTSRKYKTHLWFCQPKTLPSVV